MRYSAFISYNHRDVKHASWLHRALERYIVPQRLRGATTPLGVVGRRLPPVFQDREELAASSNLAESVRDALAQSASLIVICSPNACRSKWVNEEIREFIRLGRRDRIHLLIVDGQPSPSSIAPGSDPDSCFPPALFERGESEPLAADLRPTADGPRNAFLKVLAAMLGVEFDELRRREQARRQRRLLVITVAASLGFLVMTALTVFAFIARREAVEQRDLARQRTATAERTVEFVQSLFEVSDPSEAKGRQISAQEVLDKGAARISSALKEEPEVKAELMTTLSRVYLGLGSYRQGDAIIRQSLALPVQDAAIRARQLSVLGDSQARQGDYAAALATFEQAITFAHKAQDEGTSLLPVALIGRGEARSRLEDYAKADADIRQALALYRVLGRSSDPDVARGLEASAFNLLAAGKLDEARPPLERALAIRMRVQGLAHPKVSEIFNELGSLAYLQRDSRAAETWWIRALRSDELVLGPNHPDLAVTLNNIGRVQLERRNFSSARALLQRAANISLAQQSPTHDDLAFTYANLALADRGLGRRKEAEDLLNRAWQAAVVHRHRNRGPILTELADLLCSSGRSARGLALLAKADQLTAKDYPDDAWRRAWVLNTRGACLISSGRTSEGRAAVRESLPTLQARWPTQSLYGSIAAARALL